MLAAVVLGLTGCASYSGNSLVGANASREEVRALMGEPSAIHRHSTDDGISESWEYPRGPVGRHTFMVRMDQQGKVRRVDQVLTVGSTASIAYGVAKKEDVRRVLGRPGAIFPSGKGGETWDYAAISQEGYPRKIRLMVTFDEKGIAVNGGESYDPEEFSPNEGGGGSTL